MDRDRTTKPLIRVDTQPGDAFDTLQINVPVPRVQLSSTVTQHLRAAGREMWLAFEAMLNPRPSTTTSLTHVTDTKEKADLGPDEH
ncbi:MAG TPA: hypothetical protein VIO35_00760 [Chloroflexota bacterium]